MPNSFGAALLAEAPAGVDKNKAVLDAMKEFSVAHEKKDYQGMADALEVAFMAFDREEDAEESSEGGAT